jgi:hypothetical protein
MEYLELVIQNLIDNINEKFAELKPGNPPVIDDLLYRVADAADEAYQTERTSRGSIHGQGNPHKNQGNGNPPFL